MLILPSNEGRARIRSESAFVKASCTFDKKSPYKSLNFFFSSVPSVPVNCLESHLFRSCRYSTRRLVSSDFLGHFNQGLSCFSAEWPFFTKVVSLYFVISFFLSFIFATPVACLVVLAGHQPVAFVGDSTCFCEETFCS